MNRKKQYLWAVAGVAAAVGSVSIVIAAGSPNSPPSSSPSISAKQRILSNEAQSIAQGQAGGLSAKQSALANLSTPGPRVACTPIALPFPRGGVVTTRQGGPFGSAANFQAVSSWAGSASATGPVYAVWSGATSSASGSAAVASVDVYTETLSQDGCSVSYTHVGVFTTNDVVGPLAVVGASGHWLTLSSPSGQQRYFDLSKNNFASNTSTG